MIDTASRVLGCLYGMACGDAMGVPSSFMSQNYIRKRWGWIDTFQHSWIIYVIAGGAMAVLSGMDKNRKTEEAETVPAKQEEDE